MVGSVQAWSDSSSEYTFTQNVSIDPDDDGPHQPEAPEGSNTVLCSSLLYDGEFLVTSQAMMINGGDLNPPAFDQFSDFDDTDDDEDDDDDNDGHSSMLSNSSVRRSLATANGASSYSRPKSQDKNKPVIPTAMNTSPPASRTRHAFVLSISSCSMNYGRRSVQRNMHAFAIQLEMFLV